MYDDIYRIDNVRLIKKDGERVNLDLSSVNGVNNGSFVNDKIDDKNVYVSSNTDAYGESYSYFEVDLSSYSLERKFLLQFVKKIEGTAKYSIYVTNSSVIPYYLSSLDHASLASHIGETSNVSNDMELIGGSKYYVYIYGFNDNDGGSGSSNTFKGTDESKWLKENAYKYGFILRYEADKQEITGYKSEEWHYRYVGLEAAKYIYENDITLEEYCVRFLYN